MADRGGADSDKVAFARIKWDPRLSEWTRDSEKELSMDFLEGKELPTIYKRRNPKRAVRQIKAAEYRNSNAPSSLVAARRSSGGMVLTVWPDKDGIGSSCQVVKEWDRCVTDFSMIL
jgi:hypothetical protein